MISARAAPPRWMHPRRPNAEKPPLGDQGEVARRSRDGGDQKWRGPTAYNPSVSLRLTGRVAKCNTPGQNDELRNAIRHFDSPAGGLLNAQGAQGRPLHTSPAKFLCIVSGCCYFATAPFFLRRRERAVRRTALHAEPCGPMWASAPTRRNHQTPSGIETRSYKGRKHCRRGTRHP